MKEENADRKRISELFLAFLIIFFFSFFLQPDPETNKKDPNSIEGLEMKIEERGVIAPMIRVEEVKGNFREKEKEQGKKKEKGKIEKED